MLTCRTPARLQDLQNLTMWLLNKLYPNVYFLGESLLCVYVKMCLPTPKVGRKGDGPGVYKATEKDRMSASSAFWSAPLEVWGFEGLEASRSVAFFCFFVFCFNLASSVKMTWGCHHFFLLPENTLRIYVYVHGHRDNRLIVNAVWPMSTHMDTHKT